MKSKLLFMLCSLLFTSCSTTIVYAPKAVYVHGEDNQVEIQGSDLKDNKADQSSAWDFKIPWK